MIQGKGFFQIRKADGTIAYSRAGNFQLDRDGNMVTGNGEALAARVCSQCHSVEVVMRHRLTRRQWMAQIDTMISKGAKVEDDDFETLADYLAAVFAPAPAP